MANRFALSGLLSTILFHAGCSGGSSPPSALPPALPPPNEKGVEVHVPGVDVKVDKGGLDVKAPGADVQVEKK